MKRFSPLLLFFVLLFFADVAVAQHPDSVKAYIAEFIEPDANISVTYGTGSLSLEYTEQTPLTPLTQAFIDEQLQEYERTNDPLTLYSIGQTYRRMNRRSESKVWIEKALREVEFLMEKYPDSIELVETAHLIYMDTDQKDIACLAAKMVSDHYKNSESLFSLALSYSFIGQYEEGVAACNKGMLLYPGESKWYLARMINEFTRKIQRYGFGTEAFRAEENRIDRSFLDEGYANYPDSLEIELISVLGNFFLFAYEDVMPDFLEKLAGDTEVEGFKFEMEPAMEKELNVHFEKVSQLLKRKAFKNWHAVHYTMGTLHLFRSEPKKAVPYFEKAIALMKPKYRMSQDNVYHYYDNLITCHLILGNVASAEKSTIARATEEINLDPLADYYIEMALYRAMDKDFKAAKSILDETVAMDSTAINALSYKALILLQEDQADEALAHIEKAQAINPNDLIAFKSLVLYNLLTKNSALAEQQINQLAAYDPSDVFLGNARRLLTTE